MTPMQLKALIKGSEERVFMSQINPMDENVETNFVLQIGKELLEVEE